MRVGRAKRRWMRWCRYVSATQTIANRSRGWGTDIHTGQARAYSDVMHANRWAPKGVRAPYYPRWATVKDHW